MHASRLIPWTRKMVDLCPLSTSELVTLRQIKNISIIYIIIIIIVITVW